MSSSWQSIAQRKKQEQLSRIPKEYLLPAEYIQVSNVLDVPRACGLLTAKELRITEDYDATALAHAIRNGELKALDVARAFCKRAAIAHQLV
jgi:amidase